MKYSIYEYTLSHIAIAEFAIKHLHHDPEETFLIMTKDLVKQCGITTAIGRERIWAKADLSKFYHHPEAPEGEPKVTGEEEGLVSDPEEARKYEEAPAPEPKRKRRPAANARTRFEIRDDVLRPWDIAKKLGLPGGPAKASKVYDALIDCGLMYQRSGVKGPTQYAPTEEGKVFALWEKVGSNQLLHWRPEIVDFLRQKGY